MKQTRSEAQRDTRGAGTFEPTAPVGRVRTVVRSPLMLILWILVGICVAGGVVEWLFLGGLPWEGLGSAGVIAGVIEIVARVKGVPAWPWRDRQVTG